MLFQQAVQEKFRQATENIDDLNKWLEKVEREIASQSIPHEDVDGLKNQINALKVSVANEMIWSDGPIRVLNFQMKNA